MLVLQDAASQCLTTMTDDSSQLDGGAHDDCYRCEEGCPKALRLASAR